MNNKRLQQRQKGSKLNSYRASKYTGKGRPQHDDCPEGADSWCTWQKAKSNGELSEYRHKPALKEKVFTVIHPLYEELSRDDLLERCLGGYTQNANESFNACVWALPPKTVHSGKQIVEIAANMAACNFNDGLTGMMQIMRVLQLEIGTICHDFCKLADTERVERAEARLTEGAKEARRSSMAARKHTQNLKMNVEGLLYGPGIAD